jgi:hypothetical protein
MEGFSFVTPVTGLNRPDTGKEDDDDDDRLVLIPFIVVTYSAYALMSKQLYVKF